MSNVFKKTKILFLTFLLVGSSFTFFLHNESKIVSASANYTDFEVLPSSGHFSNLSSIKLSIYVTPRTGYMVDTLQVGFVNFSKDKLQCTDVAKGNIINGTGYELWIPGTIDNDNGQVTDILWSRAGSKATNPGYMCNLTFDVIALGDAFINISNTYSVYNETQIPSIVKSNSHIYFNKIILSNPYPPDNGTGYGQSEVLHINTTELNGDPINVFWYSHACRKSGTHPHASQYLQFPGSAWQSISSRAQRRSP